MNHRTDAQKEIAKALGIKNNGIEPGNVIWVASGTTTYRHSAAIPNTAGINIQTQIQNKYTVYIKGQETIFNFQTPHNINWFWKIMQYLFFGIVWRKL